MMLQEDFMKLEGVAAMVEMEMKVREKRRRQEKEDNGLNMFVVGMGAVWKRDLAYFGLFWTLECDGLDFIVGRAFPNVRTKHDLVK